MVDVRLAGFNVDYDALSEVIQKLEEPEVDKTNIAEALHTLKTLTPETLSVAYARISRFPDDVHLLRRKARVEVEKARKSYKGIVLGMGHRAVAEHAQFNFDIIGVSRKVIETIESKRLQGYTEKSQRYIKMEGDFNIPFEIKGTPLEDEFIKVVELGNSFYRKHLETLIQWHNEQDYKDLFKSLDCEDNTKRQKGTIEGLGKEDARYPLSIATQAQLGMTTSARNLEVLITVLKSSHVTEEVEIGEKLYAAVEGIAPTVVKYTIPTSYFLKTRNELKEHVGHLIKKKYGPNFNGIDFSEEVIVQDGLKRDAAIIAGLIFSSSNLDYEICLNLVNKHMTSWDRDQLDFLARKYQEKHDPVLREYELGDRVAQFVMSSSAFAQFKRHRMNTVIPQAYNLDLGYTIPPSIEATGLAEEFKKVIDTSSALYIKMISEGISQSVAEYALTNAHRRRVLLDANNRQIHAWAAERMNLPAQWDIRRLVKEYVTLMKEHSPLTLRGACGKDKFYDMKETLSGNSIKY